MSIVGWSLGGIFARRLALRLPELVRQVITLGSPVRRRGRPARPQPRRAGLPPPLRPARRGRALPGRDGRRAAAAGAQHGGLLALGRHRRLARVPAAAAARTRESIGVRASHLGLGHHPAVLWIVADRLAQAGGRLARRSPPRPGSARRASVHRRTRRAQRQGGGTRGPDERDGRRLLLRRGREHPDARGVGRGLRRPGAVLRRRRPAAARQAAAGAALPAAGAARAAATSAGRSGWTTTHFQILYHVRHTAVPAAGQRRAAAQPRRPGARPAAGHDQAAVGGLAGRGPGGRPLGAHQQGAPRAGRRRRRHRPDGADLRRRPGRAAPGAGRLGAARGRRRPPRAVAGSMAGASRARPARQVVALPGAAPLAPPADLLRRGRTLGAGRARPPPGSCSRPVRASLNGPIGPHRRWAWAETTCDDVKQVAGRARRRR